MKTYWEVVVLRNGNKFFVTKLDDETQMLCATSVLSNKFPEDEGYTMSIVKWNAA